MAKRSTFQLRTVAGALAALVVSLFMTGVARGAEQAPTVAKVGFELQSLRKLNLLTGDFEADFRLSFSCSATCKPGGFQLENGKIVSAMPLVDSPAQKVFLVRAQLTADIDTRRFPFDQQALEIRLMASEDGLQYELDPTATPLKLNVSAAEWIPGNQMQITPGPDPSAAGAKSPFRYTFGFTVDRPMLESILRYMLPALALMFSSLLVLFLDPDDFKTRLGMTLSSFIGQIFLQVSFGGKIPVRQYLTYWDKYLIISYLTVSMIVVYVWWDNILKTKERSGLRRRLISITKVAIPAGWLGLQILMVITTLR